ncbi:DUF1150 family protein [Alkalicaulis satelles]|uniref:DUF1150 family protein n=1 Tax=Alkalicaulis satelles TaxID=2609175 RepID=A0A5M6ZGU9_9PROT|nr:DUF1150 family protein [Alkalicaulis satelles]KAA5803993.1 DUF1150 family protein [Alkalicaulis satelles]
MSEAMTHNPDETAESGPTVYVRAIAGAEVMDAAAASDIQIRADDTLYAIHDERGQRMAVFSDRDAAFAAARWHGAQPVSVH